MGRENFIPWNPRTYDGYETLACRFFYVEYMEFEQPEDSEFFWTDFQEFIRQNIPNSFVPSKQRFRDNEYSLYENKLVEVGIADNEWGACIYVRELETDRNCRNFAPRYVEKMYKTLGKLAIKNGYEVKGRSSAWTSEKLTLEDFK